MASGRKRNFFQRLLPFISDNKQLPPLPSLRQLNDSVHEFYSPQDGTSLSVEIIFLHGLEPGDYREAYVETWTSFLDSEVICWPQTLLAEKFHSARILSVSYDSSVKKGPKQGIMDLYLTGENLVHDLVGAGVAANLGIPVVLVGKDVGGLVIKQICMEAKAQNRLTFLSNLKGIFFYGTPHLGIEDLPARFDGDLAKTLKYGNKAIARLGSNFSKDRKNKWVTRAIMSRQRSEKMPELVMTEASQRHDGDECFMSFRDSIDRVCEYQARNSSSFQFLTSFISSVERGELMLKNSPDQGHTGFKTSLSFRNDENYVPMQTTLAEVRNALQKACIVVLHGDPGSGKSSLARYLALEFESAAQQQVTRVGVTSSAEQSSWLPNGVVYMTCGNGAEIVSIQQELLRKFDMNPSDKSIALNGVQLQKVLHQELVDHLSKLKFRVVVVLDDVWDDHLVENLLVPGDQVRYLVTTQILTLWNAHDSKRVEMQDLTLEDARHILGNYANFENGVIQTDLKNLADEIIVATELHPLALATLGVVLANMQSTVKSWQKLRNNLKEYLNAGDYRPSSFGQKYPLSVNSSMMLMFNLLDEDAKKLLYKISLFRGPYRPEILLRLFLMYTLPRHKKINITTLEMSLVAKGLVQITTGTIGRSPFNKSAEDIEFIWIHSLRQHFILTTKTEEIRQTTDFLDDYNDLKCLHLEEVFNLDVVTALCALYGAADIKKRAVQRMGSHFVWSEEDSSVLAISFRPFLPLMLSEGDSNIEEHQISQIVAEVVCHTLAFQNPSSALRKMVFLKYVHERKLDGDKISYLLKLTDYPSAPLATLRTLERLFFIEKVNWCDEGYLSFVNVIISHVDSCNDLYRRIQEKCPAEATLTREYALRALGQMSHTSTPKETLVLHFPNVFIVLAAEIQRSLAERTRPSSQIAFLAAQLLGVLGLADLNTRRKLCDAEGALSTLAQSMSAHDNRHLQKFAAETLANLAHGDLEIKSKICNAEGTLSALVQCLFVHDNNPQQQVTAGAAANMATSYVEIRNVDEAPPANDQFLSEDEDENEKFSTQALAAAALANLANGDEEIKSKICNVERALSALGHSLSAHDNHPLQETAAGALANLAQGDVKIKSKICNADAVLSALVHSLSAHDHYRLQKLALEVLATLANGDVDIKSKICNAEGALSALVQSLSAHDNCPLQEFAAGVLANLATGDGEIKSKICNADGALSALVHSLSVHDNHPLQEWAVGALLNLAQGDVEIKSKICNADGALSALVHSLLAHDNCTLQHLAAGALANLAATGDVEITSKICNVDGALSALVHSLSAHDNHPLQESAAGALANLAYGDVEIKSKICNADGALSALVQSLYAHDNHPLQQCAAKAFAILGEGDMELKSKICDAEGALSALVQSLSAHDNHPLQYWAAGALAVMASGNEEIKSKICNAEGALSALVQSLSAHDHRPLQHSAAAALALMALGDEEIKSKVCYVDGALSALVQSLSAHDNHPLQKWAGQALAILAEGNMEIKSKICNAEGAISALVQSLSAHDNHPLQEWAGEALAILAEGDMEIKSKICNAEGALSALVQSLYVHDNHPLQQSAAKALAILGEGDMELKSKICNAEGALSALVQSLSAHDNHPLQQWAAWALAFMATGDVEIKSKLCDEEGAVSGLVKLMLEQDNGDAEVAAAWAVSELASTVETARKVANAKGALEGLCRAMSQDYNSVVQKRALRALDFLALFLGQ